jgi:hypothetical protein
LRDRANTSNDPANRSGARSIGAAPTRFLAALCFAALAAFAAFASPALGAQTHLYTGTSFGPDGVGGTESFEYVQSLAVDPANGDTYVYDGGAGKVYKFDSAGAPANFSATGSNAISGVGGSGSGGGALFQVALAPAGSAGGTAGDIYVANGSSGPGVIQIYAPSGAKLGELEQGVATTGGVATDTAGNLYVGVYGSTINKFTPSANPPIITDKSAVGTVKHDIGNVAADGLGNVYAANYSGGGLYRLEGIGDTSPTLIDSSANTMAIAPGSNDLYADRGNEVFQYDSDGNPIGHFGNEEISESHGVAINSGASKIYVGTSTKVKVFGPATLVPDAVTEAADAVTKTMATLHGTVGAAGGPDATCVFQFVTESAFFEHGFEGASEKPCSPAGPFTGASTTAVSATATGLSSPTNYRFRLLATSSNGSNGGPALSFSTPGAVNVQSDQATNVTASSATLNGTINPEGIELEECFFEYGTEGFGSTIPCAESPTAIGSGNSPVSVHADLTGLNGGSEYQFRLAGKSELGSSQAAGAAFKSLGPSIVGTPGVTALDTTAKFSGEVNPNLDLTFYRFEYVTKADFEVSEFANAEEAPVGGDPAGSGSTAVEVKADATGLQPNSDYVVRLVASNASGDAVGQSVNFRTYSPATSGLPDGRVYEQVTPATALEKNAVSMTGDKRNESYATPAGDAVTYGSVTGAGETASANLFPLYITRRSADGWSSAGFNPPTSTGTINEALGFTEDLSGGYTVGYTPGGTGGVYLYEPAADKLVAISTAPSIRMNTSLVAESAGGNVVIFESLAKLTPDATEGKFNVYAWSKSSGELRLVSILPGGVAAEGAFGGPWDYVNNRPQEGGATNAYYTQSSLSRDGSKAFFTTQVGLQLYMRENPTSPTGTTTQISKSQKTNGAGPGGTDPKGPKPAMFLEATPNGRYVFFMSHEALTNDANTGNFDQGQDLYRYDTATGDLIDVAPEPEEAGTETFGLIGTSTDGSYAYFVAGAALAPGASQYEQNVYLWHQGEPIRYVATLVYGAEPDEENFMNTKFTFNGRGQKASRVTPDGRTLLFSSNFQPGLNETYKSAIFRWELGGDGVVCVSCNPTGLRQSFYASLQETPGPIATPPSRSIATRNLSPDGKRVFFSTPESLVPNDVNGVEDVYEWEANGKGSCTSEKQNGGCIFLISTGTSPENSYISDISESGDDVFFFTGQRLVGQDKDDLYDEYDARVGGGIASQNPTPVRPCEGEACRGASTAPTAAQPRGTSTFSGSGNEKPKKKHKKKKHKKKKHKKHSKKKGHNKKSGRNSGGNR